MSFVVFPLRSEKLTLDPGILACRQEVRVKLPTHKRLQMIIECQVAYTHGVCLGDALNSNEVTQK